jgi:outer membrane protein OmpA-like peptidoglycan-associated protein
LAYLRIATLLLFATIVLPAMPFSEPDDGPSLTIVFRNSAVHIRGDASSIAHEAILRSTVSEVFADGDVELAQRLNTPPGWALLTEMTLRAIASTWSATATISSRSVVISGMTDSADEFEQQLKRLEHSLLTDMVLDVEVATIHRSGTLQQYCHRVFEAALSRAAVEFASSGLQPATRSYPLLDELVEIAADCPAAKISVIGHTDATGEEPFNIALSEDRARAVVAHMVQRGLPADRFSTFGAGSSQPIASNENPQGRRRNRRIEFEISFD